MPMPRSTRRKSEWPELGMRVLEPGEAMSLDMRLEVVPHSAVPVEACEIAPL